MHARRNDSGPFYLVMSLVMLAIVTYGFSRTVGAALVHTERPHRLVLLLTIHGVIFYAWMLFFVLQSLLVRMRNLRLHRLLGWIGAADGVLVVVMGIWASYAEPGPPELQHLGIVSMAGFGIPLALAIFWRRRPADHRRLLLMSTAMLTNAAFARMPGTYLPNHFFYAGTDLLILAGVIHDVWTQHRIHPVYRYGLPLFVATQIAVLIPAWRYLG